MNNFKKVRDLFIGTITFLISFIRHRHPNTVSEIVVGINVESYTDFRFITKQVYPTTAF